MRVNKKTVTKWVKALRSDKFAQTKYTLQNGNGFCCLGVACKITIPEKKQKLDNRNYLDGSMPQSQKAAPKWLQKIDSDFSTKTGTGLASLNDGHGADQYTFNEIADLLEAVYIHKVI